MIMKLIQLALFLLLFLTADIRLAQAMEGLPEKVAKQINSELSNSFVVKCYLKPCFLEGDFNGDGLPDYAVPLVKKGDMKRGIIFLHKGEKPVVVGAGNSIGAGDNFNWVNEWQVIKKNEFERTFGSDDPLSQLKGDGVKLEDGGGGSILIYWNGNSYTRYITGD